MSSLLPKISRVGIFKSCNTAVVKSPSPWHTQGRELPTCLRQRLHYYSTKMARRSFPAIFARGGTSNGLVINRRDLPSEDQWHTILPAAMGSPDGYGRQLNGMGSGISSTSKICVLSPTDREDADVEFTFVQVGIKDGTLDLAGNCGNMSSIVGPVAFDEGYLDGAAKRITKDENAQMTAMVRIYNTNTSKVIHSRFKVAGDPPSYSPDGDYEMDGVPGTNSRITLSFLNPAGAKTGKALPTGNPVDVLKLPDGSTIEASLVDVSNPGVFVRVSDLPIQDISSLNPTGIEDNPELKIRLEQIRQAGTSKMGLDPQIQSVPKIVMIFPQSEMTSDSADIDIKVQAMSMGQAHKAVPLTLALCLGAATKIPGTIPAQIALSRKEGGSTVIGHPSGKVEIGTTMDGEYIASAELLRTARVMMKGDVYF